jgi:L-malate glycosyltransferase
VEFARGLSAAELGDRYRAAHVFCCLSEHEGFCIPVLEALHFGVPVVTRPSGAIPEIAGDAALYVEDRDPAVVAELIALAAADGELRGELRRRAAARLAELAPARTEAKVRTVLEALS